VAALGRGRTRGLQARPPRVELGRAGQDGTV